MMSSKQYIENNAWVTANNDFFCQKRGELPMFSLMTPFYVLNTQIQSKQSSIAHLAIVTKDGAFCLSVFTSLKFICDVIRPEGTGIVQSYSSIILVPTLAQKRSSLMNNSVDIDFSPPGDSWLSV